MQEELETILRGGQFKRILENSMTEIRKATGLKRVEVEVIHFLHICGEKNTMKDICMNLQMNKGHISTAMDSLCKKQYVVAVQDKEDRRYVHYFLTDKSALVAERISEKWNDLMAQLSKGISEKEVEHFKRIARIIGKNMDAMLNK